MAHVKSIRGAALLAVCAAAFVVAAPAGAATYAVSGKQTVVPACGIQTSGEDVDRYLDVLESFLGKVTRG